MSHHQSPRWESYLPGAFCLLALALFAALAAPGGAGAQPPAAPPAATLQPPPATPVPTFDEQLWAAMGQEAWYVQNGYTNAPPPAARPPVTPRLVLTGTLTPGAYLPYAAYEYVPSTDTPTPTRTPTPTATATNPPPQNVEARAIWITRFDWTWICAQPCALPGPSDIQQMVANVASAGFNMILFQIRGTADAYYTPGLEPWSSRLTATTGSTLGQDPGWDPLAVMIAEAHARGIQVHAYFNTFPTWLGTEAPPNNTTPLHAIYRWGQEPPAPPNDWKYWRVWDTNHQWMLLNSSYLWASPGNDWVVDDNLVATANDIVSRYAVDGLHLDLVRYPGGNYSCDPRSEERWGASCFSGGDYAARQKEFITELVSRMYNEAVIPQNRHVALSAAVWWYPRNDYGLICGPGSDYYQDSYRWLGSGGAAVVDYEMPMMYGCSDFASDANWIAVMQGWLNNRAGRQVFPGISSDPNQVSFSQIVNRINAERAYAAAVGAVPGHAIFSYGAANSNGYWDDFAAGPYAQAAYAPTPTWHP
jgi:uncharacterized lipoprotein YddW (UPF0748 family)